MKHLAITRRDFARLSLFGVGLGLSNCASRSPSPNATTQRQSDRADLTIWWDQGFLPEENQRIVKIVRDWEQQSGKRVDLKLLSFGSILPQLSKVLKEPGNPEIPDVVYSIGVDTSLTPKLAWRDRLLDLSDVIEPIKDRYTPAALSQVAYRNAVRGERSYYALPLWEADNYIHYWQDMLAEIGFSSVDVPRDWQPFWQFWQSAQTQLRSRGYDDLHSIGLCLSESGFDTYTSLMMFFDAYDVEVVNDEGEFLLPAPEQRQKAIAALTEFTNFFAEGYIPPVALTWGGAGNNNSFISRDILMTHNLTLSIPLTQKLPPSPYNQDANDRYQRMVTMDLPNKVNGDELPMRKGIKQAIVPKAALHPEAAREFLTYLVEPERFQGLITSLKGRMLPVMPQLFEDSIWRDPNDPHLAAALEIYQRPGAIPYEVIHSAFSQVQSEQLWAKMVLKVVREGATVPVAVDWVIAQINDIWQEWEQ